MPRIENKHDSPETYEHWELATPELSPRSALYQIRPIGIGTAESECLTSYLARLANAHHLSVGNLLIRYFLPMMRDERALDDKPLKSRVLKKMCSANGESALASHLVSLTERLTVSTGLLSTTFIPWRNVVSRVDLQRRIRAWCSVCYADQAAGSNIPYDPLLWTVLPVKMCPAHHRPLTENCPKCQKRAYPVLTHYLPGLCPHCNAWLGSQKTEAKNIVIDDLEYELWVADNIGAIIAASPLLTVAPARQNVTDSINHCRNLLTEGITSMLARVLDVRIGLMRNWIVGQGVPHLKILARLSYLTKARLFKLLTDSAYVLEYVSEHPVEIMGHQVKQPRYLCRGNPISQQKVRERMEAALLEIPPPSLVEVAQSLGYRHGSTLRGKFPELSKKLTANYMASERYLNSLQSWRRSTAARPNKESQKRALERELGYPCPASLTEISERLGYNTYLLTSRFPDLCHALVVKRRRALQLQLAERLSQYRQILEAALREEPPPTLNDVARRFTEFKVEFLHAHFPDECRRLIARHADYCKRRMQSAGELLRQALQDNPPRSLTRLSKESGYSISALTHNYPELSRSIVVRYDDYRRNLRRMGR
jgi:AraC-like DNA-binding protein